MGQGKLEKLPKLGDITLPVHLKHYDNKKTKGHFHCGFSFFKSTDGMSDVSNDEGHSIGSIGGTMGGHVTMSRYFPHGDYDNTGSSKYEEWAEVIIDVRDIWDKIEELLASENVKVKLKGVEDLQKAFDNYNNKLDEIKEMQKAAEEEEKNNKLADILSAVKESKPEEEEEVEDEPIHSAVGTYMIKDVEVYEDNNWNLEEHLDGYDYEFFQYLEDHKNGIIPNRDSKGKIPINIGCGVRVNRNGKFYYTSQRCEKSHGGIVTIDIRSYIGISPEAIHYYGKLKFYLPDFKEEGVNPRYSSSVYNLPLFERGEIEITRKLEEWEFTHPRYKHAYDGYEPGDNYKGFYTQDELIKQGKKVFEDLFSPEWKFKVNKW